MLPFWISELALRVINESLGLRPQAATLKVTNPPVLVLLQTAMKSQAAWRTS